MAWIEGVLIACSGMSTLHTPNQKSQQLKSPGRRARSINGFKFVDWQSPKGPCLSCGEELSIIQHRERRLQLLNEHLVVRAKDRGCTNPDCSSSHIYRPIQETKVALRRCEYGLEVVCLVLEQYLNTVPLTKIHKILTENYGVRISASHIGNLLRLGLALVHSHDEDREYLRSRLSAQGGIVLSVDAVKFGESSWALYVLRDVISGEFLLANRPETRGTDDLACLFEQVKNLDIPVLGIISDKEAAFLGAAEKVFPGVPHQLCHTHYLQNLAKPLESNASTVGRGARTAAQTVRKFELRLLKERESGKKLSEKEKQERDLALKLCTVCNTVAKSRGDSLVHPTPLKRYERLEKVAETALKASQKAGGPWPVLSNLADCLDVLKNFKDEASELARQVAAIRGVAHVLKQDLPGIDVRDGLAEYLDSLQNIDEPNPTWDSFVKHLTTVTERFSKGLFHCYDHEQLPSTNNDLEAFFGSIKRFNRKTTGRKSTSGGPLETCPEFFIEAFTLLKEFSHEELVSRLNVSPEQLDRAIIKLKELAEPSREKRSIARQPELSLEKMLEEWSGLPSPSG